MTIEGNLYTNNINSKSYFNTGLITERIFPKVALLMSSRRQFSANIQGFASSWGESGVSFKLPLKWKFHTFRKNKKLHTNKFVK